MRKETQNNMAQFVTSVDQAFDLAGPGVVAIFLVGALFGFFLGLAWKKLKKEEKENERLPETN